MLRISIFTAISLVLIGAAAAFAPSAMLGLRTNPIFRMAPAVRRSVFSGCRAQASDKLTGAKFEETVAIHLTLFCFLL